MPFSKYNVPKNETRVILYSCSPLSLLQWNLSCDILMTLAIKRIHNLPSHLSYVLHYLTLHKTVTRHWRAEAEAHWHLGLYSSRHHRRSQWQTWLHACVKTKGRHFEHLLWFSHTNRLRATSDTPKPALFRATHTLRGRQHNSSVFV